MILELIKSLYGKYVNFLLSRGLMYEIGFIFLLILVLLISNFKLIKKKIPKIKPVVLFLLILIILSHFIFALFYVPQYYKTWVDEFEYSTSALSFKENGETKFCHDVLLDNDIHCDILKPSQGWSFQIYLIYTFLGINSSNIFILNIILSSLNIFLIFIFVKLIFKSSFIALLSSFFYAISPLNLYWATSAKSNISGLFLFLLSLIFFTLFFKFKNQKFHLFAILFFIFAIQTRLELIVALLFIMPFYLIFKKPYLLSKKNIMIWLFFLFFFLSFYLPQYQYLSKLGENSNGYHLDIMFENLSILYYKMLLNYILPVFIFSLFGLYISFKRHKFITLNLLGFLILTSFIFLSRSRRLQIRFFIISLWIVTIFSAIFINYLFKKILKIKFLLLKLLIFLIGIIFLISMLSSQFMLFKQLGVDDFDDIKILQSYDEELKKDIQMQKLSTFVINEIKKDLSNNSTISGLIDTIITLSSSSRFNFLVLDDIYELDNNTLSKKINSYNNLYYFEGLLSQKIFRSFDSYKDKLQKIRDSLKLDSYKNYSYKNITFTLYKIKGVK